MSKITDLAITENGAGDAWTTANGFTSSDTGTAEVFASLVYSSATALQLGTKDIMIELDMEIPNTPAAQTGLIGYGRIDNNNDGWGIEMNTGGDIQMKAREGGVPYSPNTGAIVPLPIATRTHVLITFDRSTGGMHAYFDGVEDGNSPFIHAALNETVDIQTTGGNLELGRRLTTSSEVDATFYNIRVWIPDAGIPANIAAVAVDMAANPNEFPTTMKDVA